MTRAELERLIARHGADRAFWPAGIRQEAERLARRDPAARALLAESDALHARLVAATRSPPQDTASGRRVMDALFAAPLPPQDQRGPAGWLPSWLPSWLVSLDLAPAWSSIALLAGMALLGFVIGTGTSGFGLMPGELHAPQFSGGDVSTIVFEPDPLGEDVL
ncbi:hypothetical protein [Xanthobacter oligotrophicus]|uniref:hypothetical protein n=1 Tax=Xanthobacter oligotrophicus TaxID=2607286 RepID=UPI00165D7B39|nr:hypothetical protein [Xanthobacter oligotrophicus]MCG5236301.1 hypothetical protein [Xanthobacter oligotrophicus]